MNKRKILYFKGQFYTGKSENKWVKGKSFFKWLALLHTDQKLRILFENKNLFGKFTFNVAASLIRNNPIQKFRDFREFQWISEWSYLLWVTVTVYCWEKAEEKKVKIPSERTLLAQLCNSIQNWIHFWSQHFCRNAVVFNSQFLGD